MNIKSQTGKAPKKSKGSGLLRKRDIEQENKLRKKNFKRNVKRTTWISHYWYFYEEILKRNNSKNLEEVVEKLKEA
ncbi:hypothetical protein [Metamycoplasma hominis]|uniref:hypothetical protein n=1 Tax=Metamycoplasma hominis TaxID=2098 RepID=UPI001F2618CA|nr:hypothetical protein [Metamycoplasma hominis]